MPNAIITAAPMRPINLLAGIEAAHNRYAEFWGLGCDCFAFLRIPTTTSTSTTT